jgi:catechol 2,3-dioxygenase-like lactoylglutathione lyase family enzyme
MNSQPVFGDIAHLGHIELFTPKLDESLAFFQKIMGLHESGRQGDSIFLRAWGDYERFTLQLTGAESSGLGHVAFRAKSEMVLEQLVQNIESSGVRGEWRADNFGHGRAYRFPSPDGHHVEIYYDTEKFRRRSGDGRLARGYQQVIRPGVHKGQKRRPWTLPPPDIYDRQPRGRTACCRHPHRGWDSDRNWTAQAFDRTDFLSLFLRTRWQPNRGRLGRISDLRS